MEIESAEGVNILLPITNVAKSFNFTGNKTDNFHKK